MISIIELGSKWLGRWSPHWFFLRRGNHCPQAARNESDHLDEQTSVVWVYIVVKHYII